MQDEINFAIVRADVGVVVNGVVANEVVVNRVGITGVVINKIIIVIVRAVYLGTTIIVGDVSHYLYCFCTA
ncbi:15201_t:CDS:2, partial [Dentiscutata heterogama]